MSDYDKDYQLLRAAIDSIDMTTIINTEGCIRYIGSKYADILGISQHDAIGRPITEIIPDTHLLDIIKSGEAQRGCVYVMKNRVPIICDYNPVWNKDGKLIGAICITSMSDITSLTKLAQTIKALEHENELYRNQLSALTTKTFSIDTIIGLSPAMQQLKVQIKKVAPTDLPVLITGKTGTGKEIIADAIHYLSKRKYGKFIKINCAAIPGDLLESELFGYSSGAFSGASKGGKVGKFELANNGTLLLDEIGEFPLNLQPKLLRVLQDQQVEHVGGIKPIKVDTRIVCSTNRNLAQMVAEGTFRQDLYYRINVVELHIPPLRKRTEDIPALCDVLIQKINLNHNCRTPRVSDDVLSLFSEYDWPGNVRELEHVLERACVLSPNKVLQVSDFDFFLPTIFHNTPQINIDYTSQEMRPPSLKDQRNNTERETIISALAKSGGNKTNAAKLLNISRSLLYNKIKTYNIDCKA